MEVAADIIVFHYRLFIEEDKQERHVAMCTYLVLAASGGMLMTELQLLQAVKQVCVHR
jgi:hypothetical protein